MQSILSGILASKHTSIASALLALIALIKIWMPPQYYDKLDQSKEWVMIYGMLMAGDALGKAKEAQIAKDDTKEDKKLTSS